MAKINSDNLTDYGQIATPWIKSNTSTKTQPSYIQLDPKESDGSYNPKKPEPVSGIEPWIRDGTEHPPDEGWRSGTMPIPPDFSLPPDYYDPKNPDSPWAGPLPEKPLPHLDPVPLDPSPNDEYIDWAAQIPGVLNDLIGKILTEGNPNAVDLTSLWFADIIANTPNLSRAYTENMNQFIQGTNQRIANTEAFFNAMMGQYGQAAAEAAATYQKLQGQGDAQIAALGNLIQQVGPEFAASLARQQGDYRELQAALKYIEAKGEVDYKDFIDKFERALAKQEGEYQQFKGQGEDLYRYVMENYGGVKDTANQITQNILDAYNRVVTGEVSDASKGYIDEIYKHNQDLINQNFDETMEKERRNLVDQMAGRGILTSGVTGRAYGDIVEAAMKEMQRSQSEIAAQRAATLLEMPFKQAQAANELNNHINALTNLTSSEATDLMNILQTQYGMSKQNAELALANIVAQANLYKDKQMLAQNNYTNMINLFRDNYSLEQSNLTNKFGQMNAAHKTQADILNSMMGHDSAYHATAANRLASQGQFGNQNLALQQQMAQSIPDNLARMFDQYGGLSRDFLQLMIQRELGHLNVPHNPDEPNPLLGIIGAGLSDACVKTGTKITMADGSLKNAEDIIVGDKVKSFDIATNSYTESVVEHINKSEFTHYYRTKLMNNVYVDSSSYHPFLIYTGKKYKFGVVKYWHAIKNLCKFVFTNPTKIPTIIKFSLLAMSRYQTLKTSHRVMMDNFENSLVASIKQKKGTDMFYNYKMRKNDVPVFIANGIMLEALYDETEQFINWIGEAGESFDRG